MVFIWIIIFAHSIVEHIFLHQQAYRSLVLHWIVMIGYDNWTFQCWNYLICWKQLRLMMLCVRLFMRKYWMLVFDHVMLDINVVVVCTCHQKKERTSIAFTELIGTLYQDVVMAWVVLNWLNYKMYVGKICAMPIEQHQGSIKWLR